MATFQPFDQTIADVANGVHDFSSDSLKLALTNTAPVVSDSTLSDIVEITAGNGYPAGGSQIGITSSSQTGGLYTLVPSGDVVYTASGGTIGAFRYVVLYNDTSTSDSLISFYDYGSSITLNDGETFTIGAGATLLTGTLTA